MVSKSTHVFKTVESVELKIDVYTRESWTADSYHNTQPVVLYFHGGGLVGFDRQLLHRHIVQASLSRGWPLVSADYRLLPQATSTDILDDIKDVYAFVRKKLLSILRNEELVSRETTIMENIIVSGQSGGAYLSFMAGLHFEPPPIAIINYYGAATFQHPWTTSNVILGEAPMTYDQVEHLYNEPLSCGSTEPAHRFHPECLLPDLSANFAWKKPEEGILIPKERVELLYLWFLQNNIYPDLTEPIEKPLDDEAWKHYPPTIIIHGDKDEAAPHDCSLRVAAVIGPTPAKLFTVPGAGHSFDGPLYLGDPGLSIVEEAWKALDSVVETACKSTG